MMKKKEKKAKKVSNTSATERGWEGSCSSKNRRRRLGEQVPDKNIKRRANGCEKILESICKGTFLALEICSSKGICRWEWEGIKQQHVSLNEINKCLCSKTEEIVPP